MLAASHGYVEVVQALLAAGANPRKTDFTGHDALSFARDSHKAGMVQVIERATAATKR
jgi:ankyrin repeat protein